MKMLYIVLTVAINSFRRRRVMLLLLMLLTYLVLRMISNEKESTVTRRSHLYY